MKYFLNLMVVLLSAVFVLGACSPQVGPSATAPSEPAAAPANSGPIVLRFAISDNHGEASEPYAQEFIDQVKNLSNGDITMEPVWDAGSASQAGFEGRVIEQVKSGQADLGLAASRAWDTEGITSFQALQAPFLIDNEALAEAVATSEIASRMLDSLTQSGFVGLTLWPEDLRHPFSLVPDKPILSPGDFHGRTIRVTTSRASERLIEALGGAPMYGGGGYDGAESGLLQAQSLSGTPTATGNVTFFPKYQVLFANGAVFGKLSEAQQTILRDAATAAQKKAIAEHPSEVEAARAWCSDAGAVVLASDEQIAAFEKAAQPVFDWIEQDPSNAQLVAAIRELKAKTPASPAVPACAYELAQQLHTSDASAQTWSTGLPPNGVWQVELTGDDLVRMGVSKASAPDWAGVYTQTFLDGVFTTSWKQTEGPDAGTTGSCTGPYAVVDDFVRIAYDNGGDCFGGEVDDIQWRIDEQGLMHFHLVANQNGPFTEVKATYEAKPYQKVEKWSTGLPPNGVWQVTLTNDEVINMGVSKAKAPDWSGVYNFTFQDGVFHWTWEGTEGYGKGKSASADGSYEAVEDFVRLTSGDVVDDIQWRLDEQGLHFHLLATQNDPFTEIRAMFEARPYQKVGDGASASPATSSSPETFTSNTAWIAYQTNRSGSEGVWLIHPDGTEDHQIATNGPTVLLPDWSPDGKRLVVASRGGDTEPLYEYDLAAETLRQIFECKDPCLGDDEPAYSPDGTMVAFTRTLLPIVHSNAIGDDVPSDCSVWIGDVATGEVSQITSNTSPPCDREYNPRWSPDGTQLVYWRDPYENGKPTGTAVYIINADGSSERQLTDPAMFAGEADWSPDGEWIVFATYPLSEFNQSTPKTSNLHRIHPDGSGMEQLTFNETTDLRATQPQYTPDGKWIIFTSVTPTGRSLWAIPAEGGDPVILAAGGIYTHGTWQPSP